MNRNQRFKLEYVGVKFLLAVVRLFPLRMLRPFGARLGWIAFTICGIRRSVAVDNIRSALSCNLKEAREIACRAYMNLGRSMVEFAFFGKFTREQIKTMVNIEGEEHFDRALREGRGAVLYTGHVGNWELLAARIAATGCPFNVLVGEQSNLRVDELINSLRRAQNIRVIHQKAGLRHVLEALANNQFVAILADQDARKRGIFVDFLGRPSSTYREPARLAIARGCPIITGFILRCDDGHHEAKIQPPIWPDTNLEKEEAIRDLTQRYTNRLESFVREHPDHYFWAHRRWKTKPPAAT